MSEVGEGLFYPSYSLYNALERKRAMLGLLVLGIIAVAFLDCLACGAGSSLGNWSVKRRAKQQQKSDQERYRTFLKAKAEGRVRYGRIITGEGMSVHEINFEKKYGPTR